MTALSPRTDSSQRKRVTWRRLLTSAVLCSIGALLCFVAFEAIAPSRIEIPETTVVDEQKLSLTLQASAPTALQDETPPAAEATATPTPTAAAAQPTLSGPTPTPTPRPTPRPPAAPLPWPKTLNIVLLGSDKQSGDRIWRTDTIIIVAIEPESKKVGVIPVPRDLWVNLPNYANRINTVDIVGGPEFVKQVLQYEFGMPIHYYARVNFDGFVQAVDAVGGITVDVECRLYETGFYMGTVDIPSGPVKMDGQTALAFVRSRMTTSDFDRMRRQQAVLLAFRRKLLSPEMLPRLPELVATLSKMAETDMPLQTLLSLARLGAQIDLKDVRGFMLDERVVRGMTTESGAAVQRVDDDLVKSGLENIWNGQPLTEAIKRPKTWVCK